MGIFGRSFNDFIEASKKRKIAIDDLFTINDIPLKDAKKQVGSFWSYMYPKKEDIQKQLIDIDSLIPEINKETFDFNHWINELNDIDKQVKDGTKSWQDYSNGLKDNEKWIAKWGQETEGQIRTQGDLVKANQQARVSALAHNEAIKAQTLSAKAGKVALQALAMAGNMLLIWGITKGLELAVKGIDNLIHSAEHCKERVDEVMTSYQSTTSILRDNAKTISELSGRYDQLSKGVGNLGNNISLTEDEFEEYHNITSKIAETYPDLVDGWDAQGNAIVNLTDSVKELNAEYEKSLHNANLTLMESKDDIFKNYENTVNDITKQIEYAEKAMDIVQSKGSFYDVIYDAEGHKTSYYKAFENLGLSVDDMINGNFSTLERQLILKIQSLKDEMDKAAQDVTPLLNAYLSEDIDYQNLSDEKLKTALSTFISSLPESLVTEITENGASAGSNFVEGLVDVVKDDDSVQNALIQLLSLDTENLSYEEAKEIIDNYISIIVNALNSIGYNIDPIELQVELGLDIKNVKEDLRNRLSNGTQDLIIDDWVDSLSDEEAKLANSTAFDEALERQKKDLNGAALSAENYSAALDEVKASQDVMDSEACISPLSISQTIDQLNTKLKPAFDSLQSAYQNIFTDDGKFALNSIDILSTCDTIKSKLDEMSDPEGLNLDVDYSAYENFVRVLSDTESTADDVDEAFDHLANSITQAALTGKEDLQTMNAALEDLGISFVVNDELVAFKELINNTTALEEKISSVGLTMDDFVVHTEDGSIAATDAATAFVEEMVGAENCKQALALLQLQQMLCNENSLNTTNDINACLTLAKAAGVAVESLSWLADVSAQYDAAVAAGDTVAQKNLAATMESIKARINAELANFEPVAVDFSGVGKNAKSAGSKAGKNYKDALKEELSDLDSVISGITSRIDDQISSINEQKSAALESIDAQKEALEEAKEAAIEALEAERDTQLVIVEEQKKTLQKQIKAKQDEIDAINDAADARQREIDLQKAQYELERMQNQRTKLVYSEDKGMHYVQDTQGIRDAKESVDDAKRQIEIANLEKEKELLEDQAELLNERIDAINEYYDALIEQTEKAYDQQINDLEKQRKETESYFESIINGFESSKSKYQELTEILDKAELSAKLKQLGIDEEALLNGSEEEFNKLKDAYMNIVLQLNQGNDEVLTKLRELSGYEGTAPAMLEDSNTKLDTMNAELETASKEVGNINSFLGKTVLTTGETATNVGNVLSNLCELSSNFSTVNSLVAEEQTAFDNLKAKIDEVIKAINLKTQAIQEEQNAVSIATNSEIADFLLLKEKILEIKETLESFGTQDEGLISNIVRAIQSLNEISLENGIIGQFSNLKEAIDSVTSAISGNGASSGGESQGGDNGKGGGTRGKDSNGKSSGGGSLADAITSMGETAKEVIGESDAEGDGTVIGEFGSLKTAVDNVTSAIGSGESENDKSNGGNNGKAGGKSRSKDEDSGGLTGSIVNLGKTTEETLGEPGGDGIIGRFEQFKEPISEAAGHVQSISNGLDDIDGKEVECTITVNVNQTGGADIGGATLGKMNLDSTSHSAKFGKSNANGTDKNKGLPKAERNALISEYGQTELTVFPNGNTVFTNKPTIMDLPKGTIVFNEDQTKQLMRDKIHVGDTAHTNSTTSNIQPAASGEIKIMPLHPSDQIYDYMQKWNAYFGSTDNQTAALMPGSMFERGQQLYNAVNQITTNNISGKNQPNIHVGDIHITCPGVTSKEVAKQVGVELNHMFSGLHLDADQQSRLR